MDRKRIMMIVVVILLLTGLAACERSISPNVTRPPAEVTQEQPVAPGVTPPAATGDVMEQLELFVTQTAMATAGAGGALPGDQATPVAPLETAAPQDGTVPTAAPPAAEEAAPVPTEGPTATQAPAVVVPTATPGIPASYTVHKGEHIYCLARRYNVNPVDLLNQNGLGLNSTIYEGMQLNIPQNSSFPGERSLRAHPTTHTVSAGETIYSIACEYGDADPNAIAFANNLSAPYAVSAGQSLQIP